MAEALALAELQRWMLDKLVVADGAGPPVDAVVAPSVTLAPAERVDVYRRGYQLRLLECLRDMHPALRHMLGDDLFDGFALDYLAARPSTSYTLARLDEGFAAHLDATRPDSDEAWPDLLVDVVRFERAFLEVYDGEGAEGIVVASAADVPAAGPIVVVDPVPSLRVLRSRYPVGEYVLAVRRGASPPLPMPRSTYLALVRRSWVVELVGLEAASFAVLVALLDGADTAAAAEAAAVAPATVLDWVAGWAGKGLFRTVRAISRRGVTCS